MLRSGGFLLAVLVVGVILTGAYVWTSMDTELNVTADGQIYEVLPGATINGISANLAREQILSGSPVAFRLYARATASKGHIKAGEYRLVPGMTGRTLLSLFRSGKVVRHEITFVEGWTVRQWRQRLAAEPQVQQTLDGVQDNALMSQLGKDDMSPEGQFFPDTYQYTRGETDVSILARAHRRMIEVLEIEWARGTRNPVLASPYQALILASIVEKESGYEPDLPRIASVFLNRLSRNMRLQSDPTVIYGIDEFDGNLTRSDLARANDYNTYTVRGLPPTPICNPGLASIRATLNPEPSGFLYFVARGNGTSEFSETLEDHNAAVTRFQKAGRVENYQSAPATQKNDQKNR
ncbi:MAG: endolytic transglycosylase MltG [Pseudomonadales bacterium]